jgi:D-alanyl-lipoteichoic acid acyltransferase DltB (MBOAT superfamily)
MLFNSYVFLFAFLPVTLAVFYAAGALSRRLAVLWLTAASFYFYGFWNAGYLWLLAASIVFNYAAGRSVIELRERQPKAARGVMVGAIALNLIVLGYCKYAGFFAANVTALFGWAPIAWDVVLPIGISFYTFTQIAFLADAHQGKVRHLAFIEYALFVSYFPHLIAGPILHHAEMIRQFMGRQAFSRRNFSIGVAVFAVGLAKKVLIADSLAPYADAVFAATEPVPMLEAWIGAYAYALQIYFDFSGYSDMAIGLSKMMNIDLPLNFYSPYKATSVIEFWRRWHMTLSRFLRDYVYVPLGGNRRGDARRYLNILLTMLLGGLWHGAAWTYVIWGGLHGLYLLINHAFRRWRGEARPRSRLALVASWALTFTAVTLAWVFFRATSLDGALRMLGGMVGLNSVASEHSMRVLGAARWLLEHGWTMGRSIPDFALVPALGWLALGLTIALLLPNAQQIFRLPFEPPAAEVARRERSRPTSPPLLLRRLRWRPTLGWAIVCGLLYAGSIVWMSGTTRFLYFQF